MSRCVLAVALGMLPSAALAYESDPADFVFEDVYDLFNLVAFDTGIGADTFSS